MKIGITGTYSTGKTTLIEALSQNFLKRHIDFGITKVSQVAAGCPFPINKSQTLDASLWILNQTINTELVCQANHKITITDRTVIDIWAMSKYALQNQREVAEKFELISLITKSWVKTYDFIFRTRIDEKREPNWIKIPDDDLEFRDLIDSLQSECLESFGIDVIELPHDEKERLKMILTITSISGIRADHKEE